MPTALQPVRGTRDLIGEDARRHRHVADTARRIAERYGFEEWITPVIEDTAVFARTLGETSDVVTKEMYSFTDRGGDSITLRPEATAGLCRALVSNGLAQSNLPRKVFYAGPMFRYERPQKGRYRQFHQIDAEIIGAAEPLPVPVLQGDAGPDRFVQSPQVIGMRRSSEHIGGLKLTSPGPAARAHPHARMTSELLG